MFAHARVVKYGDLDWRGANDGSPTDRLGEILFNTGTSVKCQLDGPTEGNRHNSFELVL
jgi:hypothetical protein